VVERIIHNRGGQLDQLLEPQQSARAMSYSRDQRSISIFGVTYFSESLYLALTFIKSKHLLAFDWRTLYWVHTNSFNQIKYFVFKTRTLLKLYCATNYWRARAACSSRAVVCHPWPITLYTGFIFKNPTFDPQPRSWVQGFLWSFSVSSGKRWDSVLK
jgi:hypothetical protein